MNAATLTSIPADSSTLKSKINPLRSLMEIWERDTVEEEEGETELMVMLSGMIGQQFFGPGGE
jgi:hypothetical protein